MLYCVLVILTAVLVVLPSFVKDAASVPQYTSYDTGVPPVVGAVQDNGVVPPGTPVAPSAGVTLVIHPGGFVSKVLNENGDSY